MKRIVVTFAGRNEVKAAEVIARAVNGFLKEEGFKGAVVQIKAYRRDEEGIQNPDPVCAGGRRSVDGLYKPVRYQKDMGDCQKPGIAAHR